MMLPSETWTCYAEALAFLGNSLLSPMSQTEAAGLDPAFWAAFPSFGDEGILAALEACEDYARESQIKASEGNDPVRDASVEHTRLFVGPPHPAAAPWETMYRPGSEGAKVGFGQAAFEMRDLLRSAGLEVSNTNNQYSDHIGIELLYASALCRECSKAADGPAEPKVAGDLAAFVGDRLLIWLPKLQDAVNRVEPEGYFSRLLRLCLELLMCLRTFAATEQIKSDRVN